MSGNVALLGAFLCGFIHNEELMSMRLVEVNNNTNHTCSVALCSVVLLPGTDWSNVFDL